MSNTTANILRFLLVLLAQIFVFNYIHLFSCVNAYIYLLALLMLPFDLPRWLQYLIGFVTGFIVDMFSMTYGVNASACTLMMLLRPHIVAALNGRKNDDTVDKPYPGSKDFPWLLLYTLILILAHQIVAVMWEAFTFRHFWKTLLVILGNTVLTSFVILCCQYIFIPVKKHN
ncbi:MAG: rod shape-determining protein MreD [Bacteroidales bacterium]|nr:rod shape-determining protein MreD [Bacteroidales bacterium]